MARHLWMEFPHPRDFQKHNPQPRSAPHEFDHDIRTLPWRPDFHCNGALSTDKNERWCHWQPHQHTPLFTACRWQNLQSQGAIKCTLALSRKITAHNNQHGCHWKMAVVQQWRWKMAAVRRGWEVALGGGLRFWWQHWEVAVAEEHAMMALASALSKPRAHCYNVGVSFGEDGKRGCVRCKGRTSTAMARR